MTEDKPDKHGWRDIASAPKGKRHTSNCALHSNPTLPKERCFCDAKYTRVIIYGSAGDRYGYQDEHGQWRNMMHHPVQTPTHWQPRPQSPEESP